MTSLTFPEYDHLLTRKAAQLRSPLREYGDLKTAAEKSNVGEPTCGMNQVVTSEVGRPAGLIIGATRDCLFRSY
jgi:hypothetical protein